jgi:hypothetical protein
MAIAARRAWGWIAVIVVVLAAGIGLVLEDRLWREQNQPNWIRMKDGEQFGEIQFKYLSIGTERDAGMPYWVLYVLPSMFPDKLPPKKSGYGSFGLSWEQTVELPVGLTKVMIGYPRVGFNCALCHATLRERPDGKPELLPARPADTAAVAALSRFFYECAKDPRFNSDNILGEIANFKKLDWIDQLLYRFYIIPATKNKILDGGHDFLWAYRGQPTKANGDQGHGYGIRLSDSEERALIGFVRAQ